MKVCFIIAESNRGGILERIAREIGKGFDNPIFHYGVLWIPDADHYFVTHYSMVPNVIAKGKPTTAFFTHDKGNLAAFVPFFNQCHSVVAESPDGMELLESLGVKRDLLHFVPEGGDNVVFQPHARKADGAILICGTNYADGRKNPELVVDVMKLLPNRKFILLGKRWNTIEDTGNLDFVEDLTYEKSYPEVYGLCSVFLSCSKLEGGGPNSLIEAMHANLVPVVSDTGNAQQYIVNGYNGYIFPHDSSAEHVASLIEQAYQLKPQDFVPYNDIWQTVRSYTWPNYTLQMKEIMTDNYSITNSQQLEDVEEQVCLGEQ